MDREIRQADRRRPADARQQGEAEPDEQHDGDDFDHREPVLDTAEAADAARVDEQQSGTERQDPNPLRRMRKPPLTVDGDRHCFPTDRNALRSPVAVAHHEAGPRVDVHLGVHAEGARSGVGDGHLRERAHEEQRDHGADEVADQHSRARRPDSEGTAQKQPGPDRTADRDHAELPRGQRTGELLTLLDRVRRALVHLCQSSS